jgi:hypothetical protein
MIQFQESEKPHDYFDEEEAIDKLKERGYNIAKKNETDELLWSLYTEILTQTPQQFYNALNQIFIKRLNVWI